MIDLQQLVNTAVIKTTELANRIGDEHIMLETKIVYGELKKAIDEANRSQGLTQEGINNLGSLATTLIQLVDAYDVAPNVIDSPEHFSSFTFTVLDSEGDTVNAFFSEEEIATNPSHYASQGINNIKDWFDIVCRRMPQRGDRLIKIVFDPSEQIVAQMKSEADY